MPTIRTDEDRKELIKKIKQIKKEKNLSTQLAAKEVGVTLSNYYSWLQKFNMKPKTSKVEVVAYTAKNPTKRKYTKKNPKTSYVETQTPATGKVFMIVGDPVSIAKFYKESQS
jgi:Zn-dependent metalloprotease